MVLFRSPLAGVFPGVGCRVLFLRWAEASSGCFAAICWVGMLLAASFFFGGFVVKEAMELFGEFVVVAGSGRGGGVWLFFRCLSSWGVWGHCMGARGQSFGRLGRGVKYVEDLTRWICYTRGSVGVVGAGCTGFRAGTVRGRGYRGGASGWSGALFFSAHFGPRDWVGGLFVGRGPFWSPNRCVFWGCPPGRVGTEAGVRLGGVVCYSVALIGLGGGVSSSPRGGTSLCGGLIP